MARHIARALCFAAAGLAGFTVWTSLEEVFGGRAPMAVGAGVAAVVFVLLYFPLGRPVADLVADRLGARSTRHHRAGVGLDEIPAATPCRVCGGPGGPVCPSCRERPPGRHRPATGR